MVSIGYALSSEEHPPRDLVRHAQHGEAAGFSFALISDHYHPWIDQQGQSPFVWTVLGATAQATERLQLGTGVTCPLIRTHPAIIAQAAATTATMMPGRFFLGVGTGENLNEHILGDSWPSTPMRHEMLTEAVELIRELWGGDLVNHYGEHYVAEQARIYTLPDAPPPIFVAASASGSAKLAGEIGEGLISTAPAPEVVQAFEDAGGDGKPRIGMVHVCWAETEEEGLQTAHKWWPNSALKGNLGQELRLPADFEAAAALVRPEDVAKIVPSGPDVERHLAEVRKFIDAGYDHVYVHQVGPDQDGFIDFCQRELLPRLELEPARLGARSD
jgi:G6PDH family F420-dependent oxidoreductase